jgi:hypothetical protein
MAAGPLPPPGRPAPPGRDRPSVEGPDRSRPRPPKLRRLRAPGSEGGFRPRRVRTRRRTPVRRPFEPRSSPADGIPRIPGAQRRPVPDPRPPLTRSPLHWGPRVFFFRSAPFLGARKLDAGPEERPPPGPGPSASPRTSEAGVLPFASGGPAPGEAAHRAARGLSGAAGRTARPRREPGGISGRRHDGSRKFPADSPCPSGNRRDSGIHPPSRPGVRPMPDPVSVQQLIDHARDFSSTARQVASPPPLPLPAPQPTGRSSGTRRPREPVPGLRIMRK